MLFLSKLRGRASILPILAKYNPSPSPSPSPSPNPNPNPNPNPKPNSTPNPNPNQGRHDDDRRARLTPATGAPLVHGC